MDITRSTPLALDLPMIALILGVVLWALAHLFKRIAPQRRAALGPKGRGPVALAILVSVVLMAWGYLEADGPVFWGRHAALTGVNNLLMLVSVYLFAVSGLKTRLARYVRHPQLTAVKVWALAHLLVNGAVQDLILFGGMMAWAVVEVIVINRAEPGKVRDLTHPTPPLAKEIRAVVGTVLLYVGLAAIHYGRGYNPFG